MYLNLDNIRHRTATTKLRISCHKLHIETGRYNRTPLEERICRHCNLNTIEDEEHLVLECSLYNEERAELYKLLQCMFPHFIHLSNTDKFIFLMTLDKPSIIKHVCTYIYIVSKKREEAKLS